ncbi:GNAT family N-acetyltransferase [Microlunatus sp. Gsoil 973]|uniref:GNAT family N-acetyltransferase n=1 Tax=Microlunatus sp. Gsoil 973 TaxID=2672569 RepID=UPI0012B45FCC|nr:GNAT family N-acetyltransferase [Microlunatus sp. Gsoil 973]QGN34614.1 GNAT family N-acetyltransferase [Microlunatus sp. Gsoil 973]
MRIEQVDLTDQSQLVKWNEVLRIGYTTGRDAAWWRSAEATVSQFRSPKPGRVSVALLASRDGRPVGAAEAHVDPGEVAEVELSVLPDRRRELVGVALAGAVRTSLAGRAARVRAETYSDAGIAFAEHLGLEVGNRESRQLLDLPVSAQRLAQLDRPSPDVEVTAWTGHCPEELVDDWARLTRQMDADVPMGELTRSTRVTDVAAVRENEDRMRAQGYVLVNSLARIGGRAVGYTEMLVSGHDPDIVNQDDTLVDRAHRGRGIGRALKLANLRQLQKVPEARDSRWVQTYTATDNAPMLALNRAVGFREADIMTALEGPLTT